MIKAHLGRVAIAVGALGMGLGIALTWLDIINLGHQTNFKSVKSLSHESSDRPKMLNNGWSKDHSSMLHAPSRESGDPESQDQPNPAPIATRSAPAHYSGRVSVWRASCLAVDKILLEQRDQRLWAWRSNPSAAKQALDPFVGTLSSAFVEYHQGDKVHQLRIGVAQIDEAQNTARYEFSHNVIVQTENNLSVQSAALDDKLQGVFSQDEAHGLWRMAIDDLSNNDSVQIIRVRTRSFAEFFSGEATEFENNQVAVLEDETFQCIAEGPGATFTCSCQSSERAH
jgi:hypothetical protein